MGFRRVIMWLLLTSLIITGFLNNNTPTVAENKPKASYVALGDSLSVGLFSIAQRGFVNLYCDWLESNRYPQGVKLTNLGRYGWTSSDLLIGLKTETTFRDAVAGADVITLEIGGSDLIYGNFDQDRFDSILSSFKNNFPEIIREINSLNSSARLIVLDLYNPFPQNDKRFELANQAIEQFNQVIYKTVPNKVAPIYQAFQGHETDYISWLDKIHPNNMGHKVISECLINNSLTH